MEADFCVAALEEAIARYGRPEIFNSDQGSQSGLKWSSQHSEVGGCDGHWKATIGTVWTSTITFTRTAACCGAI
jgi:putative transposase